MSQITYTGLIISNIPKILLVSSFFLLLILFEGLQTGTCETLHVDSHGHYTYTSIQQAIDNATDGDTIFVHEGTYIEQLHINKSITLKGNGSAVTNITGDANGNVIEISSENVIIEGFHISGSSINLSYHEWDESAGISTTANNTSIRWNSFSNNHNGVLCKDIQSPDISSNNFIDNQLGIKFIRVQDPLIKNNTFRGINRTGIKLLSCNGMRIVDNAFYECGDHGILCVDSNKLIINNNHFSYNEYGMFFSNVSDMNIEWNILFNNTDGMYIGHTQYTQSSKASDHNLINLTVSNNSFFGNERHGIYCYETSKNISCINNYFEDNKFSLSFTSFENLFVKNNTVLNTTFLNYPHEIIMPIVGIRLSSGKTGACIGNNLKNVTVGFDMSVVDNMIISQNTLGSHSSEITSLNGLRLTYSKRIKIEGNLFERCTNGLSIDTSENVSINNNSFFENEHGIYERDNRNCSIRNNEFSSNDENGIKSSDSDSYGNIIENNTFQFGKCGIEIYLSTRQIIYNNSIMNNAEEGIVVHDSYNITCSRNNITGNEIGIKLSYSSNASVENNTITSNVIGISVRFDSKEEVYGIIIKNNSIYNNSLFGMNVSAWQGKTIINAENNWWGSDSGPYHEGGNPDGEGNNVTDLIDFNPWRGKNESKNEKDEDDDQYVVFILSGLACVGAITMLGYYKIENFRILFYSVFILPLYTKLKKDDIFSLSGRTAIYEKINQDPGIYYSKILKELHQKNGTVIYHLRVLENEGLIRSKKIFGKRCYFPKGAAFNHQSTDQHLSSTQRTIVNHLRLHGNKTPSDLQKELSLPDSTLGYNLKVLLEKGIVVSEKNKKHTNYSLSQSS